MLDILVDSGEKYPYTFGPSRPPPGAGGCPPGTTPSSWTDRVVAAVERKTIEDLAGSLLSGKLTYALADLTALPRAAVVVEDRYSRLFKLPHTPGARVAEALAEAQARFPSVPIVFCETRPLAQEWAYRWLGACLAEVSAARSTAHLEESFSPGRPVPDAPPSSAEIRAWARSQGIEISDRGRIPAEVLRRFGG